MVTVYGTNLYWLRHNSRRSQAEHLLSDVLETDADFTSVYHISMKEGRFFSPQMATDTTDAIVINEAMTRYLNWEKSVGKEFEIHQARKGRIIGVMKDFNFASLRESVQPLALILSNNPLTYRSGCAPVQCNRLLNTSGKNGRV